MKTYGGVVVSLRTFLTLALDFLKVNCTEIMNLLIYYDCLMNNIFPLPKSHKCVFLLTKENTKCMFSPSTL